MIRKFLYRIRQLFFRDHLPAMIWGYRSEDGRYLSKVRISNTTFIGCKKNLKLGDNIFIGHFNFIDACNGITIEEGCQVANYVSLLTHSSHQSIRLYGKAYTDHSGHVGYVKGPVAIGRYSFIGPYSLVMPNTIIGKGCLIHAYSLVQGNFPDFAVIAGNPAKVIGDTKQLDAKLLNEHPELGPFYDEWTK